ncbi:hypothetical protein G7Y89_g2512 [Cudoniella acicularis]|uniref:Uncharacterized protein n=1 Tax=Cudoniella acicularis TaxID=354080 RepID=A0A8H4RUB1_9HELO|nr:hypothetical protein G7Y89_g2512 [Cudoniella acicularis]
MTLEPLNFGSLHDDERGLQSDTLLEILTIFQTAISSSPEPNVDEKSKVFVTKLIAFSPESKSGLNTDSFICEARKNLPDFWLSVRSCWNHGLIFELQTDDEIEFTVDKWLNINSFIAKLFGNHTGPLIMFAICELRNGLEGGKDKFFTASKSVADNRVRVTCEWIVQGGWRLFRESLLNSCDTEDTTHSNAFGGGSLFSGLCGHNIERWGFWKRRLTELCKEVDLDQSVYKSIDEALQIIVALEKAVGSAFVV